MAAETHACCADTAGACRQRQKMVDGLEAILVVGLEGLLCQPDHCVSTALLSYLGDLPLVALIRPRYVVCQSLRAGKIVVAARGCHDVPLSGNLTCKASDWARHCWCQRGRDGT